MDNASEYGHLNIVRWLWENRTEGYTSWAIESALEKKDDYSSIIKYLKSIRKK